MITVKKEKKFNTYKLTATLTLGKILALQTVLEQHRDNLIVNDLFCALNNGLHEAKINPKTDPIT